MSISLSLAVFIFLASTTSVSGSFFFVLSLIVLFHGQLDFLHAELIHGFVFEFLADIPECPDHPLAEADDYGHLMLAAVIVI